MKRTLLLKTMLLLWALIVGSLSVWADETLTIGFEEASYTNWTLEKITPRRTNSGVPPHGGTYYGYTNSNSSGSVKTTEKIANPKSITFYVSKESSNTTSSVWIVKVSSDGTTWSQVGDNQSASSGITKGTWTEVTRDLSSYNDVYVGVFYSGTSANRCIDDVSIVYSTGGGTLDDCDLALTGNPITLNFDLYNNASAQVINYTTSSTGAVTIAKSDYATFSINEISKTITVTPTAVTPSAQTITVNQAADDNYEAGSTTFTLNITDSTPIPTYTATFSVNGVTTSQNYEEGAAIVFPDDPADIGEKTFVGWTTTLIDGTTNDAPTFVTSATMGNADVTYYAVFAYASSGIAMNKMQTGDTFAVGDKIAVVANTGTETLGLYQETISNSYVKNYTFVENYSTIIDDDKNWWTVSSGSNGGWILGDATNGFLYSSGSNNLSVDISNSSEWTLEDNNDNTFRLKSGRYLSCRTDLSSDKANLFRMAGSTPVGIYSFTIYKLSGGISYSDYCTTVVAATVARPTIEVAENPFLFSTTATITCETEGAIIKYSYDGETWNDYSSALTITESKTIYAKAVKDANESSIASVEVIKNLATPTVAISGNLVLDLNGETNVNAGTLNANVTYNEATVVGAEVTWSSNNEDIATINEYTGTVTIKNRGTVTFTATYAANSDYEEATATITVTVTDSKAPGSLANPYKVSDITAVEDGVYVQGIISSITEVSTQYKNATYKISEDGTTTNEFTVFRGKYLDNADFTNTNQISVGDAVVIYGNITTYNEQLQLGQGNYLVSMVRKVATPTFDPESGEVMAGSTVTISTTTEDATIYYTTNGDEPTTESAEYTEPITINADMTIKAIAVKDGMTNSNVASASYTINVTPTITISTNSIEAPAAGIDDMMAIEYANLTISDETDFEVQYYDGEGEETVAPDWMAVEVITEDGENYSVLYSIEENTSTLPRTAYFKVYAVDDEKNLVYSDLVTVTQAGVVIDYATLPFDYNGEKSNLPTGMTQSGLGSDYNSNYSPNTQLKFDSSDDYVILKINEAATELSFDIKGNSFSGGTFTVQASTDGVEYTDLEVYKDISESQEKLEKLLLNENVRYIKWVYTYKKSGNVGLGNIKVQKRLGNATVTLASACNDGEGLYYGTYSNAAGFIVPEDLIVAEVGIDGENKLIVTEYTAGDIVPANTGVMVSSETAGAHNIVLSTGATYLPAGENRLRATGNEGITATAMHEADSDCVFYRLTMHNKTDLGFYWGAAYGEAFDVVANKAYLAVPESAGARIQGFSFEDGVITGIRNITPALSEGEEAIFDLQGRRVAKPVNGLYIVNGKKIVIK